MQDYLVVCTSALSRRLARSSAISIEEELALITNARTVLGGDDALPPEAMYFGRGESMTLGRRILPMLKLDEKISDLHVEMAATETGITFRHIGDSRGTMLSINREDERRKLPPRLPESILPNDIRDMLYGSFEELLDEEGRIGYKDAKLLIVGTTSNGSGANPAIDLYIRKALDYPGLNPSKGFRTRMITLDTESLGVTIWDAQETTYRPVAKIPKHTQMTDAEALQLADLADFLRTVQSK